MSISLEALKRLNLTADQLRLVQAEAAQNAVQLDDPSSMEASLSQILCTSTGLSRFNTDPIAKAAFMRAPPKPMDGGAGGGGLQRRNSLGNLKTKIQSLTSSRSFEDLRRSADSVLNGGEDGTRSRDPRRMYQDDDSESVLSPRLRKIRSQEYLSGYSSPNSANSPHSSIRSPPTMGMAEWEERRRLKSPYSPLEDDVKAVGLFSPTASSTSASSDYSSSGRSTNSSVRSGGSKASTSASSNSRGAASSSSSRSRTSKNSGAGQSSRYQSGSECSDDYSSYASSSCTSSYHSEASSSSAAAAASSVGCQPQQAPPSPSLSNQSVLSRVSLADKISVPSSPVKTAAPTLGGPSLLSQPRPLTLASRRMPAVPPPTRAGGRVSFSKGGPVAAMAALRRQSTSKGSIAPPSFHAPLQSSKANEEQSRPQSPSTPASSQYSSGSPSSLASPVHPRQANVPLSPQAMHQHQHQSKQTRNQFFEDEVVALPSPHYSSQASPSSYEVSSQPSSSSDASSYATSSYATTPTSAYPSSPSASSAYSSSVMSPVELYQQQLLNSPKPVRRLDPAQIASESGSNVSSPKPFYANPPARHRPSLIPPVVSERIPVFEHPQQMAVPQHRPSLAVAAPVVAERKPIFEQPQQQPVVPQHRPSLLAPVVAERKPIFEHPHLHQQPIQRQRPSLEINTPLVAERKPVFEHPQQEQHYHGRERAVSIGAPVVSERLPFFEHQPQQQQPIQHHRVSLEQPGIVQERRPHFDQRFEDKVQHVQPYHGHQVDYQQQYYQQLQQGHPLASQYQTPRPEHLPSTAPIIHQLTQQLQQQQEDAFSNLAQRRASLEHLQYSDHIATAIQTFSSSPSSVESPMPSAPSDTVSPFVQMMRTQGRYQPSSPSEDASTPSSMMETPSSASQAEGYSPSSSSYYTESSVTSPMPQVAKVEYGHHQHQQQPCPSASSSYCSESSAAAVSPLPQAKLEPYTVHRNPYANHQPPQQPQAQQQQQHFVFHQHQQQNAASPVESSGSSYYSSEAQSHSASYQSPACSEASTPYYGFEAAEYNRTSVQQQVMPQGPLVQQMASRLDHQQHQQPVQAQHQQSRVPLTHQYQPQQLHQQVCQGSQRQSSPLAQHRQSSSLRRPSLEDHVIHLSPSSPSRSGAAAQSSTRSPECQAIRPASSNASLAKSGINLADLIVELDINDPAVKGEDPYGSFAEINKQQDNDEDYDEDSQQQQQQQEEYYDEDDEDGESSSWYSSDASSGAVYSEPAYYGHHDQHKLSPLSPLSQSSHHQAPSPLRRKELSQADLLDIEAEFVEQPPPPPAAIANVPRQPQTLSPLLPNLQASPSLQSSPSMTSRFLSKYGSGMLASSGSQVTMLGSAGSCYVDELGSIDFRSQDSLRRAVSFAPELQSLNDPACTDLLALKQQSERESQLYLNYRNAMRNGHTALPLSFQELKEKIEEHGLEIAFREERHTADQKSLFLLPLNGLSQPRWVPPNTNLRVGRSSNWLQAQSRVVSRNHCEILHDIHQYYIKDVGSKSGTFVNGTRIGTADTISAPRELRHGDVVQIGTDLGSEADAYGRVPDNFRSVQLMALYGYKARLSVPAKDEIIEMRPQRMDSEVNGKTISMNSSKFERLSRKAKAQRSRLASANTRLYLEFGDFIAETSAGTAIFLRPDGGPSYSFMFNNFKLTWDISMTAEDGSGRILVLTAMPGAEGVYQVITGRDGGKVVATLSVQSEHKLLVEPVHDSAAQPLIDTSPPAPPPVNTFPEHIPSPFSPAASFLAPQPSSTLFSIPSATTSNASQLSPVVSPSPPFALPFYTLTGSIPDASLIFYIRRFPGSRAQSFLGEGQLSAKKSSWGKKMLFYEARLPPAERDDDLLALATLFNVLSQTERAASGTS